MVDVELLFLCVLVHVPDADVGALRDGVNKLGGICVHTRVVTEVHQHVT